jgi:hypothetical protein
VHDGWCCELKVKRCDGWCCELMSEEVWWLCLGAEAPAGAGLRLSWLVQDW